MTKTYLKTMFKKMTVIDKATLLNLLIRQKFPGTQLQSNITIEDIACKSDYEKNYMLLDSLIWSLYGLFYKEYVVAGPGFPIFHPVLFETACEKSILYYADC